MSCLHERITDPIGGTHYCLSCSKPVEKKGGDALAPVPNRKPTDIAPLRKGGDAERKDRPSAGITEAVNRQTTSTAQTNGNGRHEQVSSPRAVNTTEIKADSSPGAREEPNRARPARDASPSPKTHQHASEGQEEPFLNGKSTERTLVNWKLAVSEYVKVLSNQEEKHHQAGVDRATYREWVLDDVKSLPITRPDKFFLHPPAELSATAIEEEIQNVVDHYLPARREDAAYEAGLPAKRSSIICEDQQQAAAANAEYLARPEIIERLGYSQSIALMIGAKHHGKTTNVRTLALSVMRGLPIWGRKTSQGAVIYAASDDEVASTRNELLNMGWSEKDDPLTFARIDPESDATPEQVLEDIADLAIQQKAVLVILDMLFDFVGIRNELSYAETRSAIGLVQWLADQTKALVVGSHHTPKYLNDAHTAANAALGSQGISARFSPIILTRKWTEGLYTVESTMTRDPRGSEIKPARIVRNAQGWIEMGAEFKEWMKWEIYAQRIIDLFDGSNRGYSVQSVAEKLGLDRSRVQNTLKELEHLKRLVREKRGRSYLYYLASSDMFERENGQWEER